MAMRVRRGPLSHDRHSRPRTSPLPGLSRFPELNVRTYVTFAGKPGVYFFSLDAATGRVWAARKFYHLPYFYATMTRNSETDLCIISSRQGRMPNFATLPGPPVRSDSAIIIR